MPRKVRVEYPGAIYHLMNRGDRREDIFFDNRDRSRFLETLGETCSKTDWQVHAYCLMSNHFHLVVETPKANLCAGMHWLIGAYTTRLNRRHRLSGHLFSGRYKSLIVDGAASGYLKSVCDYVHLNPVRAKIVKPKEPLRGFRWSSFPEYLKAPSKRPEWLRVDRLFGEWRILRDNGPGRRRFEQCLERRKLEELQAEDPEWKRLRRSWCWGESAFREQLLELIGEEQAEGYYGEEIAESVERQAEQMIREMMKELGWEAEELGRRRKGDQQKVQMAAKLRARSTVSWKWIAEKLRMGHWRSAANAVRLF